MPFLSVKKKIILRIFIFAIFLTYICFGEGVVLIINYNYDDINSIKILLEIWNFFHRFVSLFKS